MRIALLTFFLLASIGLFAGTVAQSERTTENLVLLPKQTDKPS